MLLIVRDQKEPEGSDNAPLLFKDSGDDIKTGVGGAGFKTGGEG